MSLTYRIMHRWLLMIGFSLLAACGSAAPVDCKRVEQELNECMNRNQPGEIEDCVAKYVPLSAEERYHGTWASTFEFNQFTNGKIITTEQAFAYRAAPTELDVEKTALDRYWTADRSRVMEVDFIGRKHLCNLAGPVTYIRVDRVLATRIIEDRPSGW